MKLRWPTKAEWLIFAALALGAGQTALLYTRPHPVILCQPVAPNLIACADARQFGE